MEYIQKNLGVGRVKKLNDRAITFEITNPDEIKQIIIPLFTNYPFLTRKNLNFQKFKEAFEIKFNSSGDSFYRILELKNNINTRLDYSSQQALDWKEKNLLNRKITPYWLLEAEGTFGIKNLRPYFQISQHQSSKTTLELIRVYLENLLRSGSIHYKNCPPIELNFSIAWNKKTNVYWYVVLDRDALYYLILPFF